MSSRALLRIRRKPNTFLTFLSKGLLRATFSRFSNFCNNGCARARAIIPCKKWHKVHMRAAAARAYRNPSKHSVISTISRCDVNKTYENVRLFQKKKIWKSTRARPKNVTNCCVSLVCIICLIYHMDYIQQMHVPWIVATVVRTPRSEVSQRHRAGSWVWVVSKSRLEVW